MPKLTCPCGFVHDLSPIPDRGWLTVRDLDFESMLDAEMQSRQSADSEDRVNDFFGSLYQCPKCRYVMWQKPGERHFTIYRPDEPVH